MYDVPQRCKCWIGKQIDVQRCEMYDVPTSQQRAKCCDDRQ